MGITKISEDLALLRRESDTQYLSAQDPTVNGNWLVKLPGIIDLMLVQVRYKTDKVVCVYSYETGKQAYLSLADVKFIERMQLPKRYDTESVFKQFYSKE